MKLPTIEKGIPIPERKNNTGLATLIRGMEVGDSVFTSSEKHAKYMHQRSYAVLTGTGTKLISRRVDGGWRLWKVKTP